MNDGGKGSSRRPQTVPDAQVAENWARIFAKNPDNTGIDAAEYHTVLNTETLSTSTETLK